MASHFGRRVGPMAVLLRQGGLDISRHEAYTVELSDVGLRLHIEQTPQPPDAVDDRRAYVLVIQTTDGTPLQIRPMASNVIGVLGGEDGT